MVVGSRDRRIEEEIDPLERARVRGGRKKFNVFNISYLWTLQVCIVLSTGLM